MIDLPRNHYRAILCDPPWRWESWSDFANNPNAHAQIANNRTVERHYELMSDDDILALPVGGVAADDCALFLWMCWPKLELAMQVIEAWGFTYKTCGFCWVKGNSLPLFPDDFKDKMGLGYWTRANSEVCLLATKGKPKRKDAGVRQVIQAPLREHSRKPDETHERIERLVDGPYLELFARQRRPNWDAWGNEVGKFEATA